jgi:hypothetical protein
MVGHRVSSAQEYTTFFTLPKLPFPDYHGPLHYSLLLRAAGQGTTVKYTDICTKKLLQITLYLKSRNTETHSNYSNFRNSL